MCRFSVSPRLGETFSPHLQTLLSVQLSWLNSTTHLSCLSFPPLSSLPLQRSKTTGCLGGLFYPCPQDCLRQLSPAVTGFSFLFSQESHPHAVQNPCWKTITIYFSPSDLLLFRARGQFLQNLIVPGCQQKSIEFLRQQFEVITMLRFLKYCSFLSD